jgi:hypothetical protein
VAAEIGDRFPIEHIILDGKGKKAKAGRFCCVISDMLHSTEVKASPGDLALARAAAVKWQNEPNGPVRDDLRKALEIIDEKCGINRDAMCNTPTAGLDAAHDDRYPRSCRDTHACIGELTHQMEAAWRDEAALLTTATTAWSKFAVTTEGKANPYSDEEQRRHFTPMVHSLYRMVRLERDAAQLWYFFGVPRGNFDEPAFKSMMNLSIDGNKRSRAPGAYLS